jgi:hypothetical protein
MRSRYPGSLDKRSEHLRFVHPVSAADGVRQLGTNQAPGFCSVWRSASQSCGSVPGGRGRFDMKACRMSSRSENSSVRAMRIDDLARLFAAFSSVGRPMHSGRRDPPNNLNVLRYHCIVMCCGPARILLSTFSTNRARVDRIISASNVN